MRRGGPHVNREVSSQAGTVVVGAGMAALRLVEELAAREVRGITLVGEERHLPYNRILLSALLEGTHRREALTLRPAQWYADRGVVVRTGARAVELDRRTRSVGLEDGSRIPYGRLVLATGSVPTLPPVRGLVTGGGRLDQRVHPFRGADDCERLDAAAARARRAVVLGGGLLGLQVARALAVRGLEVEVVEGGGHLLRSQVGEPAGRILARDLRRLGTAVYTGARAVRLTDEGVVLDNGYVLDADLVVLTAGCRPSTALARRAGLAVRRGVVVDETLTSSDPRIHALGDCAEHDGVTTGFVGPAWEQASVLAARLAGGTAVYRGSRTVARLRATDLDVAVLGEPERAEGQVVELTNPVQGTHRKLVVRDGVLVAATLVGDLSRVGLLTQYYDRGTVLGAGEPGVLVAAERAGAARPPAALLPDDVEVCACAGVVAGRVRACRSLEEVRAATRATTGCGGCAPTVRTLLASRSTVPLEGTPQ